MPITAHREKKVIFFVRRSSVNLWRTKSRNSSIQNSQELSVKAYRRSPTSATVTFRKIWRKSELNMDFVKPYSACKMMPGWNPNLPCRLCYNPTIFFNHLVSLCFRSRKEKSRAFKNFTVSSFQIFRRFRKIAENDSQLRHICPSVCVEQLASHRTTRLP